MKHVALTSIALLSLLGCTDTGENDDPPDTTADATLVDTGLEDAPTADTMRDSVDSADTRVDTSAPALEAVDDYLFVVEGEQATLDIASNDGGSAPFEIELVESALLGDADMDANNQLTYVSPANRNTSTRLVYEITDATGATDQATVFIGVYASLTSDEEVNPPLVRFPRRAIQPADLAVIINDSDPNSVAIGEYYATRRELPDANVIRIELPTDSDVISDGDFEPVRQQIESATPESVQAYALTWLKPYRVNCMSMTSAIGLGGYDDQYCNTTSSACSTTSPTTYFGSESTRPWVDHDVRPTMVLGGVDEAEGKALVDRGLEAHGNFPTGTAHLVRTSDSARSVRWLDFQSVDTAWSENGEFDVEYTDNADNSGSNTVEDASDMLFYFTGLARVSGIDTNTYYPGAVADHLTSFGGRLTSSGGQMSVMRWLEAGATGSYGTVVEPCNYSQKFPLISVFLDHYFRGDTLVEAYWKSVQWPGEGIFVGDPLAQPWGRHFVHWDAGTLTIETTMMKPGISYDVLGAQTPDGDLTTIKSDISVDAHQRATITVESPGFSFVTLAEASPAE